MKKYIILFFISFCFILPVSAKEKVFSLIEHDHKLYYYDEYTTMDEFGLEIDVQKEKHYQETIRIYNGSTRQDEIYLLLESKAADGSYNDLLEYLNVTVTVDGKEVYQGTAAGGDYATKKEDLHDFVLLGKLSKKGDNLLTIDYTIADDYQIVSENRYGYVIASFYTKDQEKDYVAIEKISSVELYNFLDSWVFCGVCVLFGFLLLSISYYRRKHPKKEKEEKKKKDDEEGEEENEEKEKK